MTAANTHAPPPTDARPIGELAHQLSEQTSTLIRQELQLARLEIQEKGKRATVGAGLFGGAGLLAFFGGGVLIAAIVLLLATALDAWIAALIVAGALFLLAGGLSLFGKKEVEQATPPVPEQAIESSKHDVETIKEKAARS